MLKLCGVLLQWKWLERKNRSMFVSLCDNVGMDGHMWRGKGIDNMQKMDFIDLELVIEKKISLDKQLLSL